MSRVFRASAYLKHLLLARDEHALHSPFVFELYTSAIATQRYYYAFGSLAQLRNELKNRSDKIAVTDYGTGSQRKNTHSRSVGKLARRAACTTGKGRLLFRLANYFEPGITLELGTSLGLSGLYLMKGYHKTRLYTMEGCPNLARLARDNFARFGLHPQICTGNISKKLPELLHNLPAPLDMVYFDANHRYTPTMQYFELCLSKAHENSVFIFDDINWSAPMAQAWRAIQKHHKVTLSIDLYHCGLVFFRKKQPRQHFRLRFKGW